MSRGFGAFYGQATTDKILTAMAQGQAAQMSFSVWFWLDDNPSSSGRLLDINNATSTMVFNGSAFQWKQGFSTTAGRFNIAVPTSFVWHHLAMSYDASSVSNVPSMYLDGVAQSVTVNVTPVGSASSPSTNWYIGGNSGSGSVDVFGGMIAHVAWWQNALLTAGDVQALAAGANPLLIRPDHLGFYLPLDGVSNPEPDLINGVSGAITGTLCGKFEPPAQGVAEAVKPTLIDMAINNLIMSWRRPGLTYRRITA